MNTVEVLHFGAGNIGRGFIGKVLADAGHRIVFADVDTRIVALLQEKNSYPVTIVGDHSRVETVRNVTALSSIGPEIVDKIAEVDLITTAVGPQILARIAPVIAQGLLKRFAAGNKRPLNIIACENMIRATTALKAHVWEHLPESARDAIDGVTGFADSAVDRIVPPAAADQANPLAVTVEEFSEWIVDQTQLKGWSAVIDGLELTDNLMAFIERKLFTLNTGHATAAYLGSLRGLATVRDAILDPAIRADVKAAMAESGAVLIRRYGFDPQKHAAYIDKIIVRFENPYLKDEVQRVGRQPIRKLGRNERLVRPLLGTIEYALPHPHLVKALAAALCYHNPDDEQAVELASYLAQHGVTQTLSHYAEDALPPATLAEIDAAWTAMSGR